MLCILLRENKTRNMQCILINFLSKSLHRRPVGQATRLREMLGVGTGLDSSFSVLMLCAHHTKMADLIVCFLVKKKRNKMTQTQKNVLNIASIDRYSDRYSDR